MDHTPQSSASPSVAVEAGSESPIIPEKLEVPSKELQIIQKQVLIEKLMKTSHTTEPMDVDIPTADLKKNRSKKSLRTGTAPSTKDEDFRRTFKMRSSVLDRVKTFLPEMRNANEKLTSVPVASHITVETVSDSEVGAVVAETSNAISNNHHPTDLAPKTEEESKDTYVEMNLALLEQSDSDTSSDEDTDFRSSVQSCKTKELLLPNKRSATAASIQCFPVKSNAKPESLKDSEPLPSVDNSENNGLKSQEDSPACSKSLVVELN